jgi:hypothetical protein
LDVKAYSVANSTYSSIWLSDCKDVNRKARTNSGVLIEGRTVEALGNNSICNLDPEGGHTITGQLGDSNYKYTELQIIPCDASLYATCMSGKGGAVGSVTSGVPSILTPKSEITQLKDKFRTLKMYFNFIEATVKVGDYE